ncbi:MAG: hypothetical protein U9R15_13365 [Chloroflexota bacterium]|nr:hypothetical protein [Chloroflexota bacterium]
MNKRFSILVGIILILMGGLSLAFNLVMPALGTSVWTWGGWRLWPLVLVSGGLLFVLSPFLVRGKRGLGGLFIPGMPILITGGILVFASLFDAWGAWEWLWPLEVLSLALGFLFAAIYMRNIWLLIPAIIIGANGALFQFCAVTGLWDAWAVLWTIEPLAVGLSFLVVSAGKRSVGLFVAGLILCGLGGMGLMGMTAIFSMGAFLPGLWALNLVGPVIFILVGLLLIVWNVARRSPSLEPAAE